MSTARMGARGLEFISATCPGQDYADQRYYNGTIGRFWTPDPSGSGAAKSTNPISWNMYAYVNSDPVNKSDRTGLDDEGPQPTGCYDVDNGLWIPGCDIAFGGNSFLPQTAFSKATQRLNSAVNALEDRSSVSTNCQTDLDALSAAAGQTITRGAIQNALANT